MKNAESRLKILPRSEIQELYGFPIFTYEERVKYFSLDFLEMKEMGNFRTIPSKIHFILQLGYFKAKKRFFVLDPDKIKEDIEYILKRYFPTTDDILNIEPTKPTRLYQQACILTLLHYQDCTKEIRCTLQEKAHYLATVFTKPIYIFKELINFLESHRIVLPAYSFMQHIVGKAIVDERNRLELLVIQNMPEETKMALINSLVLRMGFMNSLS